MASGGTVVNGWCHITSTTVAEGLSQQGFDSLTFDLQHGPLHYDAALPMLQAITASEVTPLIRVPWNEPGIIMKSLDAGAMGIICPMISSREECEAFVGACRYPPIGYRSFGPTRAKLYVGNEYAKHANEEVLTLAMIETAGAMDNLDEIMSVDSLDGIYIGPADLSQALGGPPGSDWEDGPAAEAIDLILSKAKEHNLFAGLHNGKASYAKRMLDKGFQFVTVGSDLSLLLSSAAKLVKEVRGETLEETTASSPY